MLPIHQSLHVSPIYPSSVCLPWRRKWRPAPVVLPGQCHGWRSLVGTGHGVVKSWTRLSDLTFPFHFIGLPDYHLLSVYISLSISVSTISLSACLSVSLCLSSVCLPVTHPSPYPIFCLSVYLPSVSSSAICLVTFLPTMNSSICLPFSCLYIHL